MFNIFSLFNPKKISITIGSLWSLKYPVEIEDLNPWENHDLVVRDTIITVTNVKNDWVRFDCENYFYDGSTSSSIGCTLRISSFLVMFKKYVR